MNDFLRKLAVVVLAGICAGCSLSQPSQASFQVPDKMTRQIVRERISAVVVTERKELGGWVNHAFARANAPKDADGGSAAPITEDRKSVV